MQLILNLFPSLECRTLPRPSADRDIVTSMEQNYDLLDEKFKTECKDLVGYLLEKVRIKRFSTMDCINGTIWAESVTKFVDLVNHGDNFVLEDSYLTAADSALYKISQRLVAEYKGEIEAYLEGKYPIEEFAPDESGDSGTVTLWSIHKKIMTPKRGKFEKEMEKLLPEGCSVNQAFLLERKTSLLSSFMDRICKLSGNQSAARIEGGVLEQFALKNLNESKRQCRLVALDVFRSIRLKIQAADCKVNISNDLLAAERKYYEAAIGPAKVQILAEERQKLEDSSEELNYVPGRPIDLRVTGMSNDRIKLQWSGTDRNNEVVDHYEIQHMFGNENWVNLPEQYHSDRSAIISKLKANTEHMFQVRAIGITGIIGNWSVTCKCSTTVSSVARGVATVGSFVGGMVLAPTIGVLSIPLSPLATLGGLVGAPIVAGVLAKKAAEHFGPKGELKKGFREGAATDHLEASNFELVPDDSVEQSLNVSDTVSVVNEDSD